MIIAVASGKGGTGKTTLATNLARMIPDATLLDCDVEEPNAHLFMGGDLIDERVFSIKVPKVDEELCNGCGECSRICQFSAIVSFGAKAMVFPEMCHGCGGCTLVCPQKAIIEVDQRMGVIQTLDSGPNTLVHGRLDIGVAMAPPLVREVKRSARTEKTIVIDAPPGTSCPVIASLRGVDFVVLVTEPTPFGLNDLELAVDMLKELAIPFGVVVNRSDIGDGRVLDYCSREKIAVLAEIPNDRRLAEAYSRGELATSINNEYKDLFKRLHSTILKEVTDE